MTEQANPETGLTHVYTRGVENDLVYECYRTGDATKQLVLHGSVTLSGQVKFELDDESFIYDVDMGILESITSTLRAVQAYARDYFLSSP